jgi:toxin ParE1/3/4
VTKKLVFRSAARADVLEQFTYLVEQNAPAAAERFLEAIDRATARILELPGIGSAKESANLLLHNLRSWPVPGFSAVRIYYQETGETIRVVRVLHGKMDVEGILEDET